MKVHARQRPLMDAFLWFLVILMAVLVVYTSVTPPSDEAMPISDKVFHYFAYLGLDFSLLLAAVWAPVRGAGRFPTAPLLVTFVTFLFGIAIEVVQAPLPERDADLGDAIANGGGALTALLLWMALRMGLGSRR